MKHLSKAAGIIALAAVIGFSMAACDNGSGKTPLGTPANVRVAADTFTLTWNAVSGAASYSVDIDGKPVSVSGTNYPLWPALEDPKVYKLKVKAVAASGGTASDSAYSDALECETAVYLYKYESAVSKNVQLVRAGARANEADGLSIIGLTDFARDRLKTVLLPVTIGAIPVIKIGDRAFANMAIESVTIPETVTAIGDDAFKNCTALTEVIFVESAESATASVPTFGTGVFAGCTELTTDGITAPAGSKEEYVNSVADSAPAITGGTATPPGGSTTNPPGGSTTNPPGGSTTNPPGGSTTNPPGGSTTNPPGGSTTNPPGGSTTNPPGGSTTNPPGGSATDPGTGGTATGPGTGSATGP